MKLSSGLPIALSLPHTSAYSFGHHPARKTYYIRVQPETRPQSSLLKTARAVQSQMSPFLQDPRTTLDTMDIMDVMDAMDAMDAMNVVDPFFFFPQRSIMRRNINNNLNSMAHIMQSLNDATHLIMRSNTASERRKEIVESPDKYEIFINVPDGMKTKDITLELVRNDEMLHLSGLCKVEKGNAVSEFRINRMFTLGKNADTANISAKLSGGILEVTVPKVEVDKMKESRKIKIAEELGDTDDTADKVDTNDAEERVNAKTTEEIGNTIEEEVLRE